MELHWHVIIRRRQPQVPRGVPRQSSKDCHDIFSANQNAQMG
jgi:hypothetical protein